MPYLYCMNTKQKMKVDIKVCFDNLCPNIKPDEKGSYYCDGKPIPKKKIEKRKKKCIDKIKGEQDE